MATQISVAGDLRKMAYNGVSGWLMICVVVLQENYSRKVLDRANHIQNHFKVLEDNYRRFTNLTTKDLESARNGGELMVRC